MEEHLSTEEGEKDFPNGLTNQIVLNGANDIYIRASSSRILIIFKDYQSDFLRRKRANTISTKC